MKIISKFIDYYDSVGKSFQGIQNQNIWLREEEEITSTEIKSKLKKDLHLDKSFFCSYREVSNKNEYILQSNLIGFAGTLFPCVKITQRKFPIVDFYQPIETYYFTFDDLKKSSPPITLLLKQWRLNHYYDLFALYDKQLFPDYWHLLNTPLFLLKSVSFSVRNTLNFILIKNPKLSEFEFYKVKDPFTCYQELDQFLTSLTIPEVQYLQVSDRYRLEKCGFDRKISFRKRKNT